MQVICLSDQSIKNIIDSLSITEDTKRLLDLCIQSYSQSRVHFLHDLFCENSNLYQPLCSPHTYIGQVNPNQILERFQEVHKRVDKRSIYVANKLDMLCGVSWPRSTGLKITDHAYDEFHWRLEEVGGVQTALECASEIYDCIENIMAYVETVMLKETLKQDDGAFSDLFVYIQMKQNRLLLTVL